MSRSITAATALLITALLALTGAAARGSIYQSATTSASVRQAAAGTLKVATPQPINSLDPFGTHAAEPGTRLISKNVYDTLVIQNGSKGIAPSLALKWTNPNPRLWIFTLRRGVQFSDGTPLTAADVKASWIALRDGGSPYVPLWTSITNIRISGKYTLKVSTSSPLATMLANLALTPIAPKALAGSAGSLSNRAVGSGPFEIQSFNPTQSAVLVPNPHYWGQKAKLKKLTLTYIPETSSVTTALLTGEDDMTWGIDPSQMSSLKNKSIQLTIAPSTSYFAFWFNEGRKPFTDVRVRQAMGHALDIPAITKALFPGIAVPATGTVPSTVFGYTKEKPYAYNPTLAKSLLAQAGYPNGFSADILWAQNAGPLIDQVAQSMVSYWKKIGVTITLRPEDRAPWLVDLLGLKWDMLLDYANVATVDAGYTVSRLYKSTAHRFGYTSYPALDPLLIASDAELNPAKRLNIFAKANNVIWNQAVAIFLTQNKQIYAWRKNVSGITTPPDSIPVFARAIAK